MHLPNRKRKRKNKRNKKTQKSCFVNRYNFAHADRDTFNTYCRKNIETVEKMPPDPIKTTRNKIDKIGEKRTT